MLELSDEIKNQQQYVCTKGIYRINGANNWDYATMFAVAANSCGYSTYNNVTTNIISAETLFSSLNLSVDKNKTRNINYIKNSLLGLDVNQVITIDFIDGDINGRMIIKQNIEADGYTKLGVNDFIKISSSNRPNSEKVDMFALYVSINKTIYLGEKAKYINYVCYESLDNLGARYGRKRWAVSKTLDMLNEDNVIKSYKVSIMDGKWDSYIMSRYDHNYMLLNYAVQENKIRHFVDGELKEDIVENWKLKSNCEDAEKEIKESDPGYQDILNKYADIFRTEVKYLTNFEKSRIKSTVNQYSKNCNAIMLAMERALSRIISNANKSKGQSASYRVNSTMRIVEDYMHSSMSDIKTRELEKDIDMFKNLGIDFEQDDDDCSYPL